MGEFETSLVKEAFDAILKVIAQPSWDVTVANPVLEPVAASSAATEICLRDPSILVIIPLQGLTAQPIVAAASASTVPVVICPIQGRFALPSSALAIGALRESGRNVELVYGLTQLPGFTGRLLPLMRGAGVLGRLKKSRIATIGNLFPNLVSCHYDPDLISARLGVTILPVSFETVRSMAASMGRGNPETARLKEGLIRSLSAEDAASPGLDSGISLHLALKQIARQESLDAFATECWSGFPRELGLNPCLGFCEDAYTLACEGDVILAVALLAARYLTERNAYVGDLYDLDEAGCLTLIHCGGSASLASTSSGVVYGHSRLARERGFETITCRPMLEAGKVTVFRLYGPGCDKLHLASGDLVSYSQSPNLEVKIKLEGDRWEFLDQCFGNHYIVVAGDIRPELKAFCKWSDITIFET